MTTREENHEYALSIIEAKNAEIATLTQRAEAAEAEKYEYKYVPHLHGYVTDNGILPNDIARTICDSQHQHKGAMNAIAAFAGSHELLRAERDALRAERNDARIEVCLANAQRGVLAAENVALLAEREALRKDAATWFSLYRLAINEANGLTYYCEDRPGFRAATKSIDAIQAHARAALDAALAVQTTTGETI